jgi:hypothetical protein
MWSTATRSDPHPRAGVFTPLRHWLLLVLLLGLVAGATGLMSGRDLHDFYVREVVAPRLQRDLGFRIGKIPIVREGRAYRVDGIVAVDPNGPFARAGFRPGDIPVGYAHGFTGFYHHLDGARGRETTVRVVRPEAVHWRDAREVTVAVP